MTAPTHTELYGDECRRLKAQGLNPREIGKRIGISDTSVRYILASPEKRREINFKRRGADPKPAPRPAKPKPPRAITPETIMEAARAFAKPNGISIEELMRRITPRDKWRGVSFFQGEEACTRLFLLLSFIHRTTAPEPMRK